MITFSCECGKRNQVKDKLTGNRSEPCCFAFICSKLRFASGIILLFLIQRAVAQESKAISSHGISQSTIPITPPLRIWTSRDGKKVEAAFVAFTDDIVSIRRKSDGKLFSVPRKRLSDEDQKWVRSEAQKASKISAERIALALELFGEADMFLLSPMTAEIFSTRDMISNGLEDKRLAEALLPVVQNVAAKMPNATLTLYTTKQPSFKVVQEILGKADATGEGRVRENILLADEINIRWHKYGWCHFGVGNNKVICLRADCSAVETSE